MDWIGLDSIRRGSQASFAPLHTALPDLRNKVTFPLDSFVILPNWTARPRDREERDACASLRQVNCLALCGLKVKPSKIWFE